MGMKEVSWANCIRISGLAGDIHIEILLRQFMDHVGRWILVEWLLFYSDVVSYLFSTSQKLRTNL